MRSRPRARGAGFSTGPALYGAFSAPLTIWGRLSRMKIIPPGFHGRRFAIMRTLMQCGGPLGGVSAGFAVPLLGLRAGVAAIALITCAIGAEGWRLPSYDGRGEQVASRARCRQTQPTGTG